MDSTPSTSAADLPCVVVKDAGEGATAAGEKSSGAAAKRKREPVADPADASAPAKKSKPAAARGAAGAAAADALPTTKKPKLAAASASSSTVADPAVGMSKADQIKFALYVWDHLTSFRQQMKPMLQKYWKPINNPSYMRELNRVFVNYKFKVPTFKMKDARHIFATLILPHADAVRASILKDPDCSSLMDEWLLTKK